MIRTGSGRPRCPTAGWAPTTVLPALPALAMALPVLATVLLAAMPVLATVVLARALRAHLEHRVLPWGNRTVVFT